MLNKVTGAPVLDKQGRVIGVISRKDIIRVRKSNGSMLQKVSQHMTRCVCAKVHLGHARGMQGVCQEGGGAGAPRAAEARGGSSQGYMQYTPHHTPNPPHASWHTH